MTDRNTREASLPSAMMDDTFGLQDEDILNMDYAKGLSPAALDMDIDWPNVGNMDSIFNTNTPQPDITSNFINSPMKLAAKPVHRPTATIPLNARHSQSLASSSSPDSSNQDSSSESSGRRKRKSSSISAPSFDASGYINPRVTNNAHFMQRNQPSYGESYAQDRDLDDVSMRLAGDLSVFSAHNSPGADGVDATITPGKIENSFQTFDNPAMRFHGSDAVKTRQTDNHQSTNKKTQFILGSDSRDNSPNMGTSKESSPSYSLGSTQHQHQYNASNISRPFTTPAGISSPMFPPGQSDFPIHFEVALSGNKQRVETQIVAFFCAQRLPTGVRKLHLPKKTISKPKFLSKDSAKAPDTLEMHASVVCASAMAKPQVLDMALRRATGQPVVKKEGRRSSAGDVNDEDDPDDPDKPLNGGEVKICSNCVGRERKRATRKRQKKQDDEELWFQWENERVLIINEKEHQEWKPVEDAQKDIPKQFDPMAMHVMVPMRIACYCRHQGEKQGFQVIFTLKDHEDNVVGQTISEPIVVTDDHKSNDKTNGVAPMLQDPMAQQGIYRAYHSTNDLQSLRQGHQQSQQYFHHHGRPPVMNQSNDMQSHSTSATMTPRIMSRQASPSTQMGSNKRRKGSGSSHHRMLSGLTMTPAIDTSHSSMTMPGVSSAGPLSAGIPGHGGFTPTGLPFGSQPEDLMGNAMAMPTALTASPPTPMTPGLPLRNQSGDNLTAFYSVPNSAHQSRSGSPVGFMHGNGYSQPRVGPNYPNPMGVAMHNQTHSSVDFQGPVAPPAKIHRLLPAKGSLAGGYEISCLGKGFNRQTNVYFGSILAQPITVWGDTAITAMVPPGAAPGPVPVYLTQGSPIDPSTVTFTYEDDTDRALIDAAMRVLNDKHNGQGAQLSNFLMDVIGVNGSSWSAGGASSSNGGYQQMGGHFSQANTRMSTSRRQEKMATEEILLRILDAIDLDESPYVAQYNLQSKTGATMLSLACVAGYNRFVAALLARGADLETRDKCGFTPLMIATLRGHVQIVRRLLTKGADPNTRSLRGYLAIDLTSNEAIRAALRTIPQHSRTRSAGNSRSRSRANSIASLHSIWDTPSASQISRPSSRVRVPAGSDIDSQSDVIPNTPWHIQSRRNSGVFDVALQAPTAQDASAIAFARGAFAALATQIQQLQNIHLQNITMPQIRIEMPNLPDVRRLSALMGAGSAPSESTESPKARSLAPPPSYAELYPEDKTSEKGLNKRATMTASMEAVLDDACAKLHDRRTVVAESSTAAAQQSLSDSDTDLDIKIGRKALSLEEQERIKRAHAKKRKTIRKDQTLWMFWFPLCIVILISMLWSVCRPLLDNSSTIASYINNLFGTGRAAQVPIAGGGY